MEPKFRNALITFRGEKRRDDIVDLYLRFLTLLYYKAILLELLVTGKMLSVKLFCCQCSKFKRLETSLSEVKRGGTTARNTNERTENGERRLLSRKMELKNREE